MGTGMLAPLMQTVWNTIVRNLFHSLGSIVALGSKSYVTIWPLHFNMCEFHIWNCRIGISGSAQGVDGGCSTLQKAHLCQ